jgi:hypothetical protein
MVCSGERSRTSDSATRLADGLRPSPGAPMSPYWNSGSVRSSRTCGRNPTGRDGDVKSRSVRVRLSPPVRDSGWGVGDPSKALTLALAGSSPAPEAKDHRGCGSLAERPWRGRIVRRPLPGGLAPCVGDPHASVAHLAERRPRKTQVGRSSRPRGSYALVAELVDAQA